MSVPGHSGPGSSDSYPCSDATVCWAPHFDHVQLALALNLLKNKPDNMPSAEYAKKLQEEVKAQDGEKDKAIESLKEALKRAESQNLVLESKAVFLENELASLHLIKSFVEIPQRDSTSLPPYSMSTRLVLLKQILLVRTLFQVSQHSSAGYFYEEISELPCSEQPGISYSKLRSLRKDLYSGSVSLVLLQSVDNVVDTCLKDGNWADDLFECFITLGALVDVGGGVEELRSKMADCAERIIYTILHGQEAENPTRLLQVLCDCRSLQLDLVLRIFNTLSKIVPCLHPSENDVDSMYIAMSFARSFGVLLSVAERTLHKLSVSFVQKPDKAKSEPRDFLTSWRNILSEKAYQEGISAERSRTNNIYRELRELITSVTKLVPDNMPLLVVALAKCDLFAEKYKCFLQQNPSNNME